MVGRVMSIGELRHKIVLLEQVSEINERGFEIQSFNEYKSVWAKVLNLSGKEYFQAAAINAENTLKFVIRYLENINLNMRILFKGKQYNIISIDNIKYEKRFIEIKALEVD